MKFEIHYSTINSFIHSYLTQTAQVTKLLDAAKILVSSANIINLLTLGRSFMYRRNSNGPSIEPCGTPQHSVYS